MLEKIKTNLRISHGKLDGEIQDMILACAKDLETLGVQNTDEENPLILTATKLYCRWHYNYENEGERYKKAYEDLKNALSMNGDYNV